MIQNVFEKLYHDEHRDYSVSMYAATAAEMGITYEFLTRSLARFEAGGKHFFVHYHTVPFNAAAFRVIARSKYLTNVVLSSREFPVPVFAKVGTVEEALDFFYQHRDIVLKPVAGSLGVGVGILPENEQDVRRYFDDARGSSGSRRRRSVLLEKFIAGSNYRVMVLKGRVISAVRRSPPVVTGDGRTTIEELIARENVRRTQIPALAKIRLTNSLHRKLRREGFTVDSVLREGETVELLFVSNRSQGGTSETVTRIMDERKKRTIVDAATEVGLDLAGVDVLTEDICDPDVPFYINEINAQPFIKVHYAATNETDDVCKMILEAIVADL